jgi:pimeloyl-ACP methyl ester carboxylesterase
VATVTPDQPRLPASASSIVLRSRGTRAAQRRHMTKQRLSKMFMFAITAAASTQLGCSDDNALDGKSIVLVHGAWMGAWAWDDVKADLESRGATVVAVELPGHGSDMTPLASITMRGYVDTVEAAIDAAPKPVMLVGHSMGGIVVTQAADERADDLDRLVYLTSFVPKDGDSLLSLSMQDPDSELATTLTIDMAQGIAAVEPDKITDVFCADCATGAAADLDTHYRDEPLAPFVQPAVVTAGGWARVTKFYLYASDDHAISPVNQKLMTAGISWRETASLPTSHSPFLSVPKTVTDQLEKFAAD